nr:MAG TPA: hypothetical protein [Caudoviricetes sp.]
MTCHILKLSNSYEHFNATHYKKKSKRGAFDRILDMTIV